MTISRRSIIAASAPALLLAGCSDHGSHGDGNLGETAAGLALEVPICTSAAPAGDAYTAEMHASMDRMMRDMHAEPPSGNPDVDFLVMMIPHHGGAVDMARLVLKGGHDPLVREIAEKILAGQISEIEGMRGRLESLRQPEPEFPLLTGNRGA